MKKILIILVLMTIVVGCGKETNNTNTTENSQNITIPDVSGLSLREGQRQLTDAGFVIKEGYEEDMNSKYHKGKISKTDPQAGTSAPKGSEITIYISGVEQTYTIPKNIIGKQYSEVKDVIEKEKALFVEIIYVPVTKDTTSGEITKVEPSIGTTLKAGDRIKITIAK